MYLFQTSVSVTRYMHILPYFCKRFILEVLHIESYVYFYITNLESLKKMYSILTEISHKLTTWLLNGVVIVLLIIIETESLDL